VTGRHFYLAWRYVVFHKAKTVILVSCITLTLFLPLALNRLVSEFETRLMSRAEATPLVIGAKGSRFDLALHALYFRGRAPTSLTMKDFQAAQESELATAVPLFVRFKARGYPIAGTTLEYFEQRGLTVARGESLSMLGDCLVGAGVAAELGLKPGDKLLSDSKNVFDIAADYPLRMNVVGVLADSGSPDDEAVFVDLKTAWVIQGIGHGHQEMANPGDKNVVLERTSSNVVASAALPQFMEITQENAGSFHFHAEPDELPVTALVVWPHDEKSRTLLLGRYNSDVARAQVLQSTEVVEEMLGLVFKVKRFFDVNYALVAASTVLFLALTILLSLRLRRREMQTMFQLGCSRGTVFWLQASELLIVLAFSLIFALILAAIAGASSEFLIERVM
jgi:putative ABC transport system permease protein